MCLTVVGNWNWYDEKHNVDYKHAMIKELPGTSKDFITWLKLFY